MNKLIYGLKKLNLKTNRVFLQEVVKYCLVYDEIYIYKWVTSKNLHLMICQPLMS